MKHIRYTQTSLLVLALTALATPAISSFVEQMNPELYAKLSQGNRDFLLSHATFAADMERAEAMLETLL